MCVCIYILISAVMVKEVDADAVPVAVLLVVPLEMSIEQYRVTFELL